MKTPEDKAYQLREILEELYLIGNENIEEAGRIEIEKTAEQIIKLFQDEK